MNAKGDSNSESEDEPWRRGRLDPRTFELLTRQLSGAELNSALLDVLRKRAEGRLPKEVLQQFARDPFFAPGLVDQRLSVGVDAELLAAASDFAAVELSPLAPLGATSAFARTDQNRVVSALRGTEVVSDPTNVLALQSALRLRENYNQPLHYVTSHRVGRAQPVPKRPNHSQHFRLFVLTSAGLEQKDHAFTVEALVRQLRALFRGLERLEKAGYRFGLRRIDWLTTPKRAAISERVAAILGVPSRHEPLDHAYYSGGVRFKLWLTTPDGAELPVGDGGTFDWVAQLTANRRAVFVATGLGSQLLPLMYRAP